MNRSVFLVAGLVLSVFPPHLGQAADPGRVLWSIGESDNSTAEFAHAPKDYGAYRQPGFFVVGLSDAKRDWSYVQPGVIDGGWAPGGPQTFEILFSLNKAPTGDCRFVLECVQATAPAPNQMNLER